MNVIVVSGFLGAGKTTVLMKLAHALSDRGLRIAIVENEVGTVGIDDARLKAEGFEVKEIYSGCICCSLRMDLVSALLEIERDYNPDVVILEPSGVAGPKQVLAALMGYGGEIDKKTLLSIVDAGRFDKIEDMAIPLVTDGIEVADLVVVNKRDLVSADRLNEIRTRIKEYRPDAELALISATEQTGMENLLQLLTIDTPRESRVLSVDEEKTGPKPTVHTQKWQVPVEDGPEAFSQSLTRLVDAVATDLQVAGCRLIGHVKAIAAAKGGGYLVVGKTDFDHSAQTKGRLPKSTESAMITLTAIVYGVDGKTVESVVNNRLSDAF